MAAHQNFSRASNQRGHPRASAFLGRSDPPKTNVQTGVPKINGSWVRMAEERGMRIMPRNAAYGWDFVPVGGMGEGLVYLRTSVMSSPYGEFPEGLRDWDMQILPKETVKNIYCRRIVTGY